MYINRARLTACEVGVFLTEISQHSEIHQPLSLRSHLTSFPMIIFFERLQYIRREVHMGEEVYTESS